MPPAAGRGGAGPASAAHASLLQALSASGFDQTGLKQQHMQNQLQQQQQQQQQQQRQQRGLPSLPGVNGPPPPFPGGFPAAGFGNSILPSFFFLFTLIFHVSRSLHPTMLTLHISSLRLFVLMWLLFTAQQRDSSTFIVVRVSIPFPFHSRALYSTASL